MEKAIATGRSFQEPLTSFRATPVAEGLPSPTEILHGRSLVTRKASQVNLTAVHQLLNLLQAKYIRNHDKARRARAQRPLVTGEEVYHSTAANNWVIAIVTGSRYSGRSYDILTKEGTSLRRNRSHLKPTSHDIPMLNRYFHFTTFTPCQSEIFAHNRDNNRQLEYFRTDTSSQSEIFSSTSNSSSSVTGTERYITEELYTPSQSESKPSSSTSMTTTSSSTA